jgi:hypothetical protein
MSTADATGVVALKPGHLHTLRVAQLVQAAEMLDTAATEMWSRSQLADVSDPGGEITTAIGLVREDLAALETLGYVADEGGES